MKLPRFLALPAVALLALAGCRQMPEPVQTPVGADFTTSIGSYFTRAADDHWDAGDQVGIYMMSAGVPLGNDALAFNRRYTTTGTSALGAATPADEIFYPDNGAAVDFVAYYPWRETITDYTYPVNVATQAPLAAIDLLWSNNAHGFNKTNPTAAMTFTHRLSKIVLRITDLGENIVATPGVTIEGIATTAGFSLVDGSISDVANPADVAMVVSSIGDHTFAAEAIVIPSDGVEFNLMFTIGDKTLRRPVTANLAAGKKYIYNITITDKLFMEGEGEIIDWDEEPGEDIDFDIKEMDELPWDGLLDGVEVAVYPTPGGDPVALVPGWGYDQGYDGPDYWQGNHTVWDCEADDDDILHLNLLDQLAAQFPKAENPTVQYQLRWMLTADGDIAEVNEPILSNNMGNITIDRNNGGPEGDNAGTFMMLMVTFDADNADIPIVVWYCIEIRDTPVVEP